MNKCVTKLKDSPIGHRMTNQRKLILDYLRCVKTHPTARQIFEEMKKKLPQISFGTIYRNLDFLVEHDYVLALNSVDGCVHYDGHAGSHPHLVCEKCGRIYDLENQNFDKILMKKKKTKHGQIKDYRLNFYGLCNNCK